MPSIPPDPSIVTQASQLGGRIREARIHRKLRQVDLADRAGVSRSTVEAIERGTMETGLGAYLRVLWAMGLSGEIDLVADPGLDREGLALSFSSQAKRVRVDKDLNNDF